MADSSLRDQNDNDILQRSVSDLPLSVRAANILRSHRFADLGELLTLTEDEIMSWRGMNVKVFSEISGLLHDLGLQLGRK